jgi:hypothetical protein
MIAHERFFSGKSKQIMYQNIHINNSTLVTTFMSKINKILRRLKCVNCVLLARVVFSFYPH